MRHRGAPKAPSEDDLLAHAGARGTPARDQAPPDKALPRGAPPADEPDPALGDPKTLWERRLARAQHTLDAYLASTRYPPTSRPISEQPDRVKPHFVPGETLHLARRDDKLTDARVTLHQDRYYLVGEERAFLSLGCENSDGPAPCELAKAFARAEADAGAEAAGAGVAVPFSRGEGGGLVAMFQPAAQGFSDHYGPIRLFVDLRVDGEAGQVAFEVMYTPAAPATFTGRFREALSSGSLEVYAELQVDKPGRYVIAARADDESGRSFAYLSFNEELATGKQEAKLPLFGKLILDQGARAPFRLRDVEGFLLKEDTYPDRELMPALEGVVYTTKAYAPRDFSDKAWESEEKDRNAAELEKDVTAAKGHVEAGH